jgi:hypothetical protein
MRNTLDVQFKRIAAMQAELDVLKAANNGRHHAKGATPKV